jgi:hypothetical protein
MQFNVTRISAEFGIINVRKERRGKDETVEAEDIPFKILGGPEVLDMLFPHEVNEEALAKVLFSEQGHVTIPTLKLVSKRKPEGLTVRIYDGPKDQHIELKGCRLTPPEVEIGTPYQVTLTAKIQIAEPTDDTMNRLRRLMDETAEIEIESENRDLFEDPADDEMDVDVDGN